MFLSSAQCYDCRSSHSNAKSAAGSCAQWTLLIRLPSHAEVFSCFLSQPCSGLAVAVTMPLSSVQGLRGVACRKRISGIQP